jgi:hypothetical protein
MGELSLGKVIGLNVAGACSVCGNDESFWECTPVKLDPLADDRRSWRSAGSWSWEEASETVLKCMNCGLQSKPEILEPVPVEWEDL